MTHDDVYPFFQASSSAACAAAIAFAPSTGTTTASALAFGCSELACDGGDNERIFVNDVFGVDVSNGVTTATTGSEFDGDTDLLDDRGYPKGLFAYDNQHGLMVGNLHALLEHNDDDGSAMLLDNRPGSVVGNHHFHGGAADNDQTTPMENPQMVVENAQSTAMEEEDENPPSPLVGKENPRDSLVFDASSGYSPVHVAAAHGSREAVVSYINDGFDCNVRDRHGNTPLHWAILEGHVDVVEALLRLGANVNAYNWSSHGEFPLLIAAAGGMNDIVRMLMYAGAHIHQTSLCGATALHAAVSGGHVSTIELLNRFGAHLDVEDNEGDSPLHYGVREGHGEAVLALLRAGADVNRLNQDGETPLDLARDCRAYAMIGVLCNHGAMSAAHGIVAQTTHCTKEDEYMERFNRSGVLFGVMSQ